MESVWPEVCDQLRDKLSEDDFMAWIRPIEFNRVFAGRAELIVSSTFTKNWIATNFLPAMYEVWTTLDNNITGIDLIVSAQQQSEDQPQTQRSQTTFKTKEPAVNPQEKYSHLSQNLDPRMTFEHFVVGKPNEFAFAAAKRVADSIAKPPVFNPLFLYGGVGLGKTHLMHAICWQVRRAYPEKVVVYLSAERFMYSFIRAITSRGQVGFKDLFRSVDLLLVDDIQFIAGKDSTQEEFFHTFNALVDQGKQVVLSADRSPSEIAGIEQRLTSRMNSGVVADIHATTYELRLGILHEKIQQNHMRINENIIEFLAKKITTNIRELEGALMRLQLHGDLIGRAITLDDAQDILHDLIRASSRKIDVEDIQKKVAEHYNLRVSELRGARRAQAIARPRQVAMYLCKQLTNLSLPEIGRGFGGKDHTTVMYAVKKIEELMEDNTALVEDIRILKRSLQS
ncbi:MAG: chromosomal replication initiator protein DnaA [Alphaproteobacteria bacterium]